MSQGTEAQRLAERPPPRYEVVGPLPVPSAGENGGSVSSRLRGRVLPHDSVPSSSKASSKEAMPHGIARSVSAAAAVFTPLLSIEVRDVNGRAVLLVSRGGRPGRSWCWGRGKNRLDLRDGARGPSRASWSDLCKAKPSASAWGQMAADGAGRSPGLELGPSARRRRDPWPASLFKSDSFAAPWLGGTISKCEEGLCHRGTPSVRSPSLQPATGADLCGSAVDVS